MVVVVEEAVVHVMVTLASAMVVVVATVDSTVGATFVVEPQGRAMLRIAGERKSTTTKLGDNDKTSDWRRHDSWWR